MTAMGHSFRTEVESKSHGKPSFLSHHLESLCPASQEEDEWLEQELDRARQQRGGFYRKIVNSRAASARELEDLAASRLRNASLGSTERDFSISQSASTSSSPPTIPEPHSSWRFYTSYDNGEWKRHCVPVYKPEEEILRKSPSSDIDKELSPAYESHLRKYRQARASLFDKPARRFPTPSSPQGETTTMRVETHGNTGGLRSAIGGSPSRLPFGGSANDIFTKTGGLVEISNSTPLPTHYREQTTTSETITTVDGQEVPQIPKLQQQTPHIESSRPKHNNLGYKEKVIIPTKYKSESEIAEADIKAKLTELAKPAQVIGKGLENHDDQKHKPTPAKINSDEPCYLGSTFEKFNYKGVPLVKPQFVDKENTKERNMVGTNAKVSVEFVKRKPVFDSPPQAISPVHNKPDFSRIAEKDSHVIEKNYQSPTTTHNINSSTERRSLPFGPPAENLALGRDYINEKTTTKFSTSDDQFQPLNGNSFKLLADSFDAPVINNANGERPSNALVTDKSEKERVTSSRGQQISTSGPSKSDGVIFIPVIRVMAPTQEERHRTQFSMDVNAESQKQANRKIDGLTGNEILELDEDLGEGISDSIQQRNRGGVTNEQSISGQSMDSSVPHFGINRSHQNVAEEDKSNKKSFTIIQSEIRKENGKTDVPEQATDSSIVKIKPDFSSNIESSRKEIPIFSSSVSGGSQVVTQKSSTHTDRLPTGEKIIIPSRYKEKGHEISRSMTENKNTDCGPALFSSVIKEAFDDKLKSDPSTGRVSFTNTDISIKQQPEVSFNSPVEESKKSSFSTTVYETRREKPIFPSDQRRFCSTVEVVPHTSVHLSPFDEDLSKQIDVAYEVRSAALPSRGDDSGFVIKTSNPSSEILRQTHHAQSFAMPSLEVTGSTENGFFRSFGDESVEPNVSADDEWVVERAVPF